MKIRSGFVSNSSSCSFCIYGVYLKPDEIQEYFGCDIDKFEQFKLNYTYGPDYFDGLFIGWNVTDCKDEQVFGDYKKEIEDKINEKAIKKIPDNMFNFFEESWYDG